MMAPIGLNVAAVHAETIPQSATQEHKYRLGFETLFRIMFDGICIDTYPTSKIEMQVWYSTSERPRSASSPYFEVKLQCLDLRV